MVEISGAIAGLKGEMVELVAPSAEFGVASSELKGTPFQFRGEMAGLKAQTVRLAT
jgi:hypothetical protein